MTGVCEVEGCGNKLFARRWCCKHYTRWRKHGGVSNDLVQSRSPNGDPERFIRNVVLSFTSDECLLWPFSRQEKGYGVVRIDGKKNVLVHRYVCTTVNGAAPSPDHQAAHSCGNGFGGCCNPRHIRWATKSENAQDKLIHGTDARGEKNCSNILSEKDVLEILSLGGVMKQSEIAAVYGVHRSTIGKILCGKNWAWLNPANDNNKMEAVS